MDESFRVAVNIRPFVLGDHFPDGSNCIRVHPAEKQVQIGSHAFTFDYIFGSNGLPCSSIYDECVSPLVDALFDGHNGTVLAYGQIGSGKSYIMENGVIPKVMDAIFSKVAGSKDSEFSIKVSFIEIYTGGISINKGLLVLGNVISALADDKRDGKKRKGGHAPHVQFRDSKLTRILQDSLGGNSKAIMIACVSPAQTDSEDTIKTLKFASRVRNLQNKAVIQHPDNAQMQSQIEQLQLELLRYQEDSNAQIEENKILKHKISELETALQECRMSIYENLTQCAIDAEEETLFEKQLNLRLKKERSFEKQQNLSKFPQTMSSDSINCSQFPQTMTSGATSSSALFSMASQLSEAEEREREFSFRGRWGTKYRKN